VYQFYGRRPDEFREAASGEKDLTALCAETDFV
jgi:hypothetical protein